MVENPLATAKLAWLTSAFDPRHPAALRHWVRTNAAPAVSDTDVLNALVLVVNEAVTTSGEAGASTGPVTVELWRGLEELRFLVVCPAMLPAVSRTELPTDPRVRALWMSLQVSTDIDITVLRRTTDSGIAVTLRTARWS